MGGSEIVTFSSSAQDAINRPVNVQKANYDSPNHTQDPEAFEDFYDISRTVRFIENGDYAKITLQFPDELLRDSIPIYQSLKKKLGDRDIYVLADTSYGSCCVDEVAASHVSADAMVHYGHACMSQTSRLPVLYVFGKKALDVDLCCATLSSFLSQHTEDRDGVEKVVLKYDVVYSHLAGALSRKLGEALKNFEVIHDSFHGSTSPSLSASGVESVLESFEIQSDVNPGKTLTIWVGEESPTLSKLIMMSMGQSIISYAPKSAKVQEQTPATNKLLMRRYALVLKARDADVFGILVGTLGVASYLPLISHIRAILRKANKKFYTISVGKINPAKLANFLEIDCWVWVSCSEGMVDSKDYFKPIITPYELEVALKKVPDWSGMYTFDFKQILDNVPLENDVDADGDEDQDEPIFSLVTGTYRHAKRFGRDTDVGPTDSHSTALTTKAKENALMKLGDSAAAHFLQERSFQGLDPRLGQDEPSILEQGRSGIARSYQNSDNQS